MPSPIDVVITCGANDYRTLPFCVAGVRRSVQGVGRIVVIAPHAEVVPYGCEYFDERAGFPFSPEDVAARVPGPRSKWYLQQLIKLYAQSAVQPRLSDHVLVVDADVVFLRPVEVVDADGRGLHNVGTEHHLPYFAHMDRLLPGLHRVQDSSGITHHMVFRRRVLDDLFERVEAHHGGKPFWQAFLDCVDAAEREGSGASEYETYHNFALLHHPDAVRVRRLPYANHLQHYDGDGVAYVCMHHYCRPDDWLRRLRDRGIDDAPPAAGPST